MVQEGEIPGYAEALAWEERTREEAFLGGCAPLCGVMVRPLSLRRLTYLLRARNPLFFESEEVGIEHLVQFLWIVSEAFRPGDMEATAAFVAEVSTGGALDCADTAATTIRDYLDSAFNDAPAARGQAKGGSAAPVASFAAALVDAVASEYHWRMDDILDAPLACLHQLLRQSAKRQDPKAVFISRRSARVRGDWLRSLQIK